jgi:hypothetical protein
VRNLPGNWSNDDTAEVRRFIWVGIRCDYAVEPLINNTVDGVVVLWVVRVRAPAAKAYVPYGRCRFIQSWRSNQQDLIVPGALAAGAIFYVFLLAWGRSVTKMYWPAKNFSLASQERYAYVIVALLLPLVMFAFERLATKWVWSRVLLSAVLGLAIVKSIFQFSGCPSNSQLLHPL